VSEPVDRDELVELMRTVQLHDGMSAPMTRSTLDEMFTWKHFDPALDLTVLRDCGRPVGWSHLLYWPSGVLRERVRVVGGVLPEYRRRGHGAQLLAWAENRARERLSSVAPDLEQWLIVDALEWQHDRRRLQRRHGFDEARWFIDMKRRLEHTPDPSAPDGIEISPWRDEHTAAVRDVNAAAFADHWGSSPMGAADWAEMIGEASVRLDLSFVAHDGDRLVGYSLNEVFPDADPDGECIAWVGSLGTLRDYRRRGIAGSLLQHSHRRFSEFGFSHAMLDVDADSPSGAGAIYERHGYEPLHRTVVSVKVLNP